MGGGRYTIDFGREVVGDIELTMSTGSRRDIRVMLGEQLKADGTAKYELSTKNTYDETWTFQGTRLTFAGYSVKAFRYVTLANVPGTFTADDIRALSTTVPDSGQTGTTTTDQDLANDVLALSAYTHQEGAQDTVTDSVTRERRPYEGDQLIYQAFGGDVTSDVTADRNTWNYLLAEPSQFTEYRLMSILGAHTDFMRTADAGYIRSIYDQLQQRLNVVHRDPATGLVRAAPGLADLVDWPYTETQGFDGSGTTYKTVINAFAYRAYSDMADLAAGIGRSGDASMYAAQAEGLRSAIIDRLWSDKYQGFVDGLDASGNVVDHHLPQDDYVALALGVVQDEPVEETLTSAVAEEGGQAAGSIYMAYFFYTGLARSGHGNLALQILLKSDTTDVRTYAHVLKDLDATMTPEAWTEESKSNMSYSHVWGTGGGSGLYDAVFGLDPTSPGYRDYDLTIDLGPLTSASGTIPTLRGSILVDAERDGRQISVSTDVPSGSTASVRFAHADPAEDLSVDGGDPVAGDQMVKLASGHHVLTLSSPFTLTTTLADGSTSVASLAGETNGWVATGSPLRSLAIDAGEDGGIEVSVRASDGDWTDFLSGDAAGTPTGQPVAAIRLRATSTPGQDHDVHYRVLTRLHGWLGWATEGEVVGTAWPGDSIIGIQVRLDAPDDDTDGAPTFLAVGPTGSLAVQPGVTSHVADTL